MNLILLIVGMIAVVIESIGCGVALYALRHSPEGFEDADGFHCLN